MCTGSQQINGSTKGCSGICGEPPNLSTSHEQCHIQFATVCNRLQPCGTCIILTEKHLSKKDEQGRQTLERWLLRWVRANAIPLQEAFEKVLKPSDQL